MFHPLPIRGKSVIPQRFTYPFNYQAHPLCEIAASELQKQLKFWQGDKQGLGKMFGVLIVENSKGQIGYLWAYSGNLSDGLDANEFVPPIFNFLTKDNFFVKGEMELNTINEKVNILEKSDAMTLGVDALEKTRDDSSQELSEAKEQSKSAKLIRQKKRDEAKLSLSEKEQMEFLEKLIQESQREKSALKQLKISLQQKVQACEEQLKVLINAIDALKQERKTKSAQLQQQLFEVYQLRNAKGETRGLESIFMEYTGTKPPAAAGDCALPRLLQYAYTQEMHPLAMAEFWWGESPHATVRKEGYYYPSCKGKCEPILKHMLQGLDVDDNPLQQTTDAPIDVLYEDEFLLAINKPAGMLSAPGKVEQKCVIHYLTEMRPDLKSLHLVHRLDMATSGILLIAKNETTYKSLQKLFLSRAIKKKYVAILDGKLKSDYGKVDLPLRVDLNNRPQQMVCHELGKPALTTWKKIEEVESKTRIAFYPITGRTHQLRMHAAHIDGLNTSIIGDELYGKKAERLMLHATSIEFQHPDTGQFLNIDCKVPF